MRRHIEAPVRKKGGDDSFLKNVLKHEKGDCNGNQSCEYTEVNSSENHFSIGIKYPKNNRIKNGRKKPYAGIEHDEEERFIEQPPACLEAKVPFDSLFPVGKV